MQIDLGTIRSVTFKMDKDEPKLEIVSAMGSVTLRFAYPMELERFITRMTAFQRVWEDQRDAS